MKQPVHVDTARKVLAITSVSLALGLLFNLLFFGKVPGISVLVYLAAISTGLLVLARRHNRAIPKTALALLLAAGFFAAMVAVRASLLLTFLNVLACVLLLLLIARLATGSDLRHFDLLGYARIPFLPLKFMTPLWRTLAKFFALGSAVKKHRLAAQIARGVILAAPILVVFLLLFASADLVFQKYVSDVFSLHLNPTVIPRTILSVFVALAFTGAFAFIFAPHKEGTQAQEPAAPALRIGTIEISILLGSVSVLFFLFILIQLAYLFGGLSNISAQGFTYAEYARRGFFELLAVAVVAFVMLYFADKTATKSGAGHSLLFRILSGALIAQVIVIMASAFKRLYLYEQAFGFTTLRLYSHVFVLFLAVTFVLLLVKILRNQPENRFAFPIFITAMFFLAGMNALNPDAFIARQNLARYHQTGKLDASYIASLSEDARPELNTAIGLATGETKRQLIDARDSQTSPSDWQSWNLARSQAGH